MIRTVKAFLILLPYTLLAQSGKFGALAIDRNNGFYYGWAVDYETQQQANDRALGECRTRGGNCTIVKQWSGGYCAVYRTINGDVGTAYGWGVARTREDADRIATGSILRKLKTSWEKLMGVFWRSK